MLTAFLFAIAAPAADYHWPLDLPRQLSSSFGEYRSGRLHAGIDLRTAGTGRAVYAAESGRVTRVRCSPFGYGKAVYIQFHDGNTAVYAHLESFAEPIGEYVRRAQHARRSYTVDLYPDAGDLPIERGQVIARSGETGVGVPHLHYEIRDPAGRPINPRDIGIDWPDTIAPTIKSVLIAPLTADSRVNGDVLPITVAAIDNGGGKYSIGSVRVSGTTGLGARLIDPANSGANKLGVRTLATFIDGVEHFRMTRDRLSYDTLSNGLVAYHPYLYDQGRYLLQWRWPGNRSEAFAYPGGDGAISAPAETAAVELVAADFHGNSATVQFALEPGEQAAALDGAGASSGTGTFSLDCYGDFLVLTAAFSSSEHQAPALSVSGGDGRFFRVDSKTFRAAIAPAAGVTKVTIGAEHPRAEAFVAALDVFRRGDAARTVDIGRARLTVSPNSPYGILFAREVEPAQTPSARGLELVTNPISVWPDNAPLDRNVEISIPLPQGETRGQQLHVYRAGTRSWSRQSSSAEGASLSISTRAFGTYAILADETPPAVGPSKVSGGRPRPRIELPVRDTGSGIADYEVTCGGDWLLTAYDPERNLLEWERDRDLPGDAEFVLFRVTDAAGNTAETRHRLP